LPKARCWATIATDRLSNDPAAPSLTDALHADAERLARLLSDLEQSEGELARRAAQLVAQSKVLSDLHRDLLTIVRESNSSDPALGKIERKLKSLSKRNLDWRNFDANFLVTHPTFRRRLLLKCPDLTRQEIRLCVLIRLGLTSNEIALLISRSLRSIENHRMHIRKKLQLTASEELTAALKVVA
jgi:DNA-binding NarL/FixJ family response regulator